MKIVSMLVFSAVSCFAQGTITTVAGNGTPAFSGDGGLAISAALNGPGRVTVDSAGNFYISDNWNNRIRKVSAAGVITTVAGSGATGVGTGTFSGDGGPATSATLNEPIDVAVDSAGNLFISDQLNNRIRKVSTGGAITTVAGSGATGVGTGSFSGDGGPATSATLNRPFGVKVDSAGNFYIADRLNNRIRKVNTAGIITTVAGNGTSGFSGDGGPATSADLTAWGLAFDSAGNLYIADRDNSRIRKVTTGGIISTVAGNGTAGFSGDGGAATSAALNSSLGVAVDAAGNLYIADGDNNRVRKVTPAGTITTVAGNGTAGFSGDGGPATSAALNNPSGVAVDSAGNLYIAENSNNRVRKVFLFIPVSIDIKPGSFPNSINLGSQGTVPVAIFSAPAPNFFDTTTVDPTTVTLAGAQVALRGKGTPMASVQDVNGDGLLDLVVHVSTQALQLSDTDTQAILTGQTYSGQAIQGSDSVRIVP